VPAGYRGGSAKQINWKDREQITLLRNSRLSCRNFYAGNCKTIWSAFTKYWEGPSSDTCVGGRTRRPAELTEHSIQLEPLTD
jgi:hypothetical protein